MKKIIILLLISWSVNVCGQEAATEKKLEEHVSFLASDQLKGRKPGTEGIEKASEYIRKYFNNNKLELLGDNGFQEFNVTTGVKLERGNSLRIDNFQAKTQEDHIPVVFSGNGNLKANVVFVGYGIKVGVGSKHEWNDYKDIDVKGKWVLILRGAPDLDMTHNPFEKVSSDRLKAKTATEAGAKGVLLVSGQALDTNDELSAFRLGRGNAQLEIPVIHIQRVLADKILKKSKRSIGAIESEIKKSKTSKSFATKALVEATVNISYVTTPTRNVVGFVKGTQWPDEYIVVGAHYDHLGMGGHLSGSRMPDTIAVHNGADDNASGTATMMELARMFAEKPAKRSLIFVAFSAEEMGLLGSTYFAAHAPVDYPKIYAMLNFDMVARPDPKTPTLHIAGTATAEEFNGMLDSLKAQSKFPLTYIPDGYGASDHSSFYVKNTPVLFFYTGLHDDYHTPYDDTKKLDFKAHANNTNFAYVVTEELANRDSKLTYKEVAGKYKRTSRGYKITFGIVPSFGETNVNGMKADGVREGGPAQKAGMQKGDIIVDIEGMKINDIYDYMDQLNKLKKGQAVKVKILRDGKEKQLTVQL